MKPLTRLLRIVVGGLTLNCGLAVADCLTDFRGNVLCGKGECQRDRRGEVSCSAFRDGSAVRNRYGEILCGKGDCVTTHEGDVFCSTVRDGAALKDRYGMPRCEGRCEPASADYCEARPAGTYPDWSYRRW